jgi:fluoride exporter
MPPQVTVGKIVAVMAGAALGGAARYLAATMVAERLVSRFPWGTFLINITGCFLIGLISTVLMERVSQPAAWSLFLVTGILGGYTTFSAFGWETLQLTRQSEYLLALAYSLGSVVCGYVAVWFGVVIARR